MSKQPETIFGEQVDKDLRKTFGKDIWIENIQQVGKRGTPDRLICIKGRFVALELKVEGGVVDKLQMLKLLEINKAGGLGFVVYPHTWDFILSKLAYDCGLYKT